MGAIEPGAPPRQRWRIAFRRLPDAPELGQREWAAAWEAALVATGLPLASTDRGGGGRPKVQLGPPLAVGMAAERELLDVFLSESLPIADVRRAIASSLPAGHELVGLHDVWVGAPALQAQVVAVVYRIDLAAPAGVGPELLADACGELLAAAALPRRRAKGGGEVSYDLRPLLLGLDVDPGEAARVRARLRVDPERGIGRPEEVVAALGDRLGVDLAIEAVVRERVVLADTGD